MEIVTHRGYWTSPAERNTLAAFERSFEAGLGAEIDVRDLDGEVVVSHDPPRSGALKLTDVLMSHATHGHPGLLAINVKADGLASTVSVHLHATPRWFAFDMSIPDTLQYARASSPYYARQSEFEPCPALYEQAAGVWIDCFNEDWVAQATVVAHRKAGKAVCLVSPELHGRSHQTAWDAWQTWAVVHDDGVSICTDFPDQAREHFS